MLPRVIWLFHCDWYECRVNDWMTSTVSGLVRDNEQAWLWWMVEMRSADKLDDSIDLYSGPNLLTLNLARISCHKPGEIWEWIRTFISDPVMGGIVYAYWDKRLALSVKRTPVYHRYVYSERLLYIEIQYRYRSPEKRHCRLHYHHTLLHDLLFYFDLFIIYLFLFLFYLFI